MEHGHGVGPSGTERAFDCGNTCALQSFVVDWMHLLAKLTDRLSDHYHWLEQEGAVSSVLYS